MSKLPVRYQETKAVVQARSEPAPPLPEIRGSKKVIQAFNGSQNNPRNKKRPITLAPLLKLSARQRKFLEIAARVDGYCPWDPPFRAPFLKTDEIKPLIDARLCEYREYPIGEGPDAWFITPAGRLVLSSQARQ